MENFDELTVIRSMRNKIEDLDAETAQRILVYLLGWNESRVDTTRPQAGEVELVACN